MKLALELHGTDKQAAIGAWVLLQANIVPLQDARVADPTPLAMSRSGRLLSPSVRHTDIVPVVFFCTAVDMIHYMPYLYITVVYMYGSAILYCTSLLVSYVYLLIVPVAHYGEQALIEFSGNAEEHGTVRIGLMACMNEVRTVSRLTTLCFVSKLLIPGINSLLLVAADCSLRVPLPALTAIENSRQGSPFPNIRDE